MSSCDAIDQNHQAYKENKEQEPWLHVEPSSGSDLLRCGIIVKPIGRLYIYTLGVVTLRLKKVGKNI